MDALILTLKPTGWHATPLGPWAAELGGEVHQGSHVSPACANADEVLEALIERVSPHVVITVEYPL